MKYQIDSIQPAALALVAGAFSFLSGLLGATVLSLSLLFSPTASSFKLIGLSFSGPPPIWLLLVYPLVTAVTGAISAAIFAWIYNLLVRYTGPIRIEMS